MPARKSTTAGRSAPAAKRKSPKSSALSAHDLKVIYAHEGMKASPTKKKSPRKI